MTGDQMIKLRGMIVLEIQALMDKMNQAFPDVISGHERLADENDQAAAIVEKDIELIFRDRDRIRLKQLKNALSRIENGSFGVCEECRGNIPKKRLEHNPVASLCITCQDRSERGMGQRRRLSGTIQ